jgi:hypothetical protein
MNLVVVLLHYFATVTHVNNVTEALRMAVHERVSAKGKHLQVTALTSALPSPQMNFSSDGECGIEAAVSPRRRIFAEEDDDNNVLDDVITSGDKWEARRYSANTREQQQPRRRPRFEDEDEHSQASGGSGDSEEMHIQAQLKDLVAETKQKREIILRNLEVSATDQSIFELQGAAKDLIETLFNLLVHEERTMLGGGPGGNVTNNGVANLRDLPPGTKVDDLARHSVSRRRVGGGGSSSGDNTNTLNPAASASEIALSIGGISHINRNPKAVLEVPFYIARGQRFPEDKPTICFYIERSKNANIVVYDCLMEVPTISGVVEGSVAIDTAQNDPNPVPLVFNSKKGKSPLQAYWLDKDPSFALPKRQQGITTDRSELNFLEKRMAYGANLEPVAETVLPASRTNVVITAPDGTTSQAPLDAYPDTMATRATVSFVALPQRVMSLHMARCHIANTTCGQGCTHPQGAWAPVITVTINSVLCVAEKVFVKSRESRHFWQLPSVDYVDLYGFSLESDEARGIEVGMLIVERIKP